MNIVICAIAKLENNYIYHWAKYHLDLGFNHIFIYDNNECDGERIDSVFKNTLLEDSVTIIDVRGQKKAQLKVYNAFYYTFEFDWCAFIDIDEFITFSPASKIQTIGDLVKERQGHNAIVLNWMCFGDCGNVHYEDIPVTDRFREPIVPLPFVASQIDGTPENQHIKSIIKKGLCIDWDEEHYPFKNPHIPAGLFDICNASGVPVNNYPWQELDYNIAFIRHYITMSIEEYTRKSKRGAADSNSTNRYRVSRFFRYNKVSLKKLIIVKKMTGSLPILSIINERLKWCSISNRWLSAYLYKSYRRVNSIHK